MAINTFYGLVDDSFKDGSVETLLKEVRKRIASWETALSEERYGFNSDIMPADEKARKQELKDTLAALERQRDQLEDELEDERLRKGIRNKYNLN